MSAVIKPRRTKKLPASTPALWLVIGLAVTFFLVRYGQEVLLEHDINARIAEQDIANAALSDETARLEAHLQYVLSDKYVEQRAREDLNLRRPDEEVLIPVDGGAVAAGGGTQGSASGESAEAGAGAAVQEKANWEGWFELFAPFGGAP
jgi:cell division protein FtsB